MSHWDLPRHSLDGMENIEVNLQMCSKKCSATCCMARANLYKQGSGLVLLLSPNGILYYALQRWLEKDCTTQDQRELRNLSARKLVEGTPYTNVCCFCFYSLHPSPSPNPLLLSRACVHQIRSGSRWSCPQRACHIASTRIRAIYI